MHPLCVFPPPLLSLSPSLPRSSSPPLPLSSSPPIFLSPSPPLSSLSFSLPPQLQGRFEQLKRLHQEEKGRLEERRRSLEDQLNGFSTKRAAAELLLQGGGYGGGGANLKKDKDRKK